MKNKDTVISSISFPEVRYKAFFSKASLECNTPDPAYDILYLLLTYYLENTFVLHRKMKMIDNLPEKELRKYKLWRARLHEPGKRKVTLRITKEENKRFTRKIKKEGVTKTYIMNLLVDFYMKSEFIIETKIIRVNKL
jgi:hypothetical protein